MATQTMMKPRSLSSQQRSPLARRILAYLRSQDPPMSAADLARSMKLNPTALSNWMSSKSMPTELNMQKLAHALGCSVADIERDVEESRGWSPPVEFDRFAREVLSTAKKQRWPDAKQIEEYLLMGRAEVWNDQDNVWSTMLRSAIAAPLSLRDRALAVAIVVRNWSQRTGDPDFDLTFKG
jgi:transcriptional regulator with XRE-family HTH domain